MATAAEAAPAVTAQIGDAAQVAKAPNGNEVDFGEALNERRARCAPGSRCMFFFEGERVVRSAVRLSTCSARDEQKKQWIPVSLC